MSTWILLRGLTRESGHWGNFPDVFRHEIAQMEKVKVKAKADPVRILAPDLPGNGRLNEQQSPVSVYDMAENLRAQLTEQGVPPPYHLLAMSLGAMVAVAWASRHPEEIRAAVLINTSLRPFNPFYRRLRPQAYVPLLRLAMFGGSDAQWENTIFTLTSRRPQTRAATVKQWLSLRQDHPVTKRNAWRQLVAAIRFKAKPERPPVPFLVLASRCDALVDARCSQQLAKRWQTAFAEHPNAGHDLPLDDGAWVAREVYRWLKTLSGRPEILTLGAATTG